MATFKVYLPHVDATGDDDDKVSEMKILVAEDSRVDALETMGELHGRMRDRLVGPARAAWPLEGFWQLFREGEWGAMERTGFAQSEPETMLDEEVGLR